MFVPTPRTFRRHRVNCLPQCVVHGGLAIPTLVNLIPIFAHPRLDGRERELDGIEIG